MEHISKAEYENYCIKGNIRQGKWLNARAGSIESRIEKKKAAAML